MSDGLAGASVTLYECGYDVCGGWSSDREFFSGELSPADVLDDSFVWKRDSE